MLKAAINQEGLPKFRQLLAEAVKYMNSNRRLKRLGNLTPLEVKLLSYFRLFLVKFRLFGQFRRKMSPLLTGRRMGST